MADVGTVDFGGRMRRLREERGVSLREIATTTKISIAQLEALERNDISRLPGGIFLRGIVRSYAQQIGSDPETTVREFIARFPDESVVAGSPQVYESDYEAATAPGVSRALIAAAVVVLLLLLAAGVWAYFSLRH
jgi:cytoskeletal protein RodZ